MSVTEYLDKRQDCDRKKSYLCIIPIEQKSPMSALSTFLVISPSWLEFRWSSMLPSILFAKDLFMCTNLSRLSVMHLIFKYIWINCISESVDHLLAHRRSQSCLSESFHLSSKISICINSMQFWHTNAPIYCNNLLLNENILTISSL